MSSQNSMAESWITRKHKKTHVNKIILVNKNGVAKVTLF